jgi:hypothetical protein
MKFQAFPENASAMQMGGFDFEQRREGHENTTRRNEKGN